MLKRTYTICKSGQHSKVCTIVGSQWGDQGKGKLVDILAKSYDIVGRFNGGANAGHTIVVGDKKFGFHLLPCGVLYQRTSNVIGNGVVLHIPTLLTQIAQVQSAGIPCKNRIFISDRSHLVTQAHIQADSASQKKLANQNIGTTKKGIGPAYMTKMMRSGLRAGDLLHWDTFLDKYNYLNDFLQKAFDFSVDRKTEIQNFRQAKQDMGYMITDTVYYLNQALSERKRLICQGANALMLDIDYGSYPFVTSSHTGSAGIPSGLGIPASAVQTCIGVVKAYTTRVGSGPFPTQALGDIGDYLQSKGQEIGVTTGRKRRCGWLDLMVVKYSHMVNGYNSLNITKLDVLDEFEEIKIGVGYRIDGEEIMSMPANLEDFSKVEVVYETLPGWKTDTTECVSWASLPSEAKAYMERISKFLGVPVSWVGTGPKRENMLPNPHYN